MAQFVESAPGIRKLLLLTVLAIIALGLAGPPGAVADETITSAGPLTSVAISSDLNCSVNHTGDTFGEFFGDTACGTLVASGGTLYGPASIPAGDSAAPRTAYTPVSQGTVTGTGTSGDPYTIVTVVDLGTSGLRITQTDSYVVGQESYRTDIQLQNNGGSSASAIIYHAGDCFLANSDSGFGAHDLTSGSVTCVGSVDDGNGGTMPGSRIEQFLPLSPGSHSYEAGYNEVWAQIGAQAAFDDTCLCDQDIDNGAGLSWNVSVPAGQSVTRSNLITFSPTGQLPLSTTKTADSSSVGAGASDGYTITIHNPNSSSVSLTSITDTLPSGFTYTTGSSTGATTSDPSVNGQGLTWSGSFSVPGGTVATPGTLSLHFGVSVANTPGDYFNNAGGTSNDYFVAPTGDTAQVTVTAPTHTLTVSKNGTGSGTVTSSPAGIDCGATCSNSFAEGTSVTLTPSASAGSTFAGWSGDCTGTGSCIVTMDQARSVTAQFDALPTNTLTVAKNGNGSGTVTSSPAGIDCGSTCSSPFPTIASVTLTPTPSAGSTFTGWSGDCTGTGSCIVTMDQARSVTATFTLVKHTLTVNKGGTGTGTVTSLPAGIDCGATCSADYDHGTSVTLTGAPGSNSQAVQWTGCDSVNGSNQCLVAMSSAKAVTATFNLVQRTLTVNKGGTGSGTVTSSPAGINCGATCSASYDHGTSVTLTAVAASGSTFTGWSGDCTGTGSCIVTMDQARSVTATFNAVVNPPPPPPSETCDGKAATIVGTNGIDVIQGTKAADVIVTLGGKDQVNGGKGNDTVCAGDGKDHVVGGPGNDNEFGEAGNDHLIGNKGNDDLDGGPGQDKCQGGAGNNTSHHCED